MLCAVARDGDRWRTRALCLLAFIAPFNLSAQPEGDVLRQPLVAVALVVGVATAMSAWWERRELSNTRRWFFGLWFLWVGLLWIATLSSPDQWLSAGIAARISVAAVVMAATALTVNDVGRASPILRSLVAGAVLAVFVGATVQLLGRDFVITNRFFGAVTRLGPYDRLTRPWSHANVAAMAIGATMAGVVAIRSASLRFAAAAVLVVGIVLTYSRGGFLSVGLGALAWITLRTLTGRAVPAERVWLGALLAVGVIAAILVPGWTGRVSGEDRLEWWNVAFDVPESVLLGDEPLPTTIGLANNSSVGWQRAGDEPVFITARWVLPGTDTVRAEQRWNLPADVAPGDRIDVDIVMDINVPNGNYDVHWDLFIADRAYFRQFAGLPASISPGRVSDSPVDDALPAVGALVAPRQLPSRLEIWSASLDAFVGSPVFGVGPGRLSETMPADAGAGHSHNLVLEPLATWGVLATVPFLALMFGGLARAWQRARRNGDRFSVALMAGLVIATAHGMVDWSLMHVSVAIPIGIFYGLAWAAPLHGHEFVSSP